MFVCVEGGGGGGSFAKSKLMWGWYFVVLAWKFPFHPVKYEFSFRLYGHRMCRC